MIWEKWQHFNSRTTTWKYIYRESPSWRKRIYEECICACWTIKFVSRENLRTWNSKNCWCVRKKRCAERWRSTRIHWMADRTRPYTIYRWILARCNNKNSPAYKRYWWRWIKCERKSFKEFWDDMKESYEQHLKEFWEYETTIDRIDNNWNYCKENCKRTTRLEQMNNTCSNIKITYSWKEYRSIAELSRSTWINLRLLRNRLKRWWSVKDAVEMPIRQKE